MSEVEELQKALGAVEKQLESAIRKFYNKSNLSVDKDTAQQERDQLKILHDNFRGHYE